MTLEKQKSIIINARNWSTNDASFVLVRYVSDKAVSRKTNLLVVLPVSVRFSFVWGTYCEGNL